MSRSGPADPRAPGVRVRKAHPSDAPRIAALYAPFVEHTTVSFEAEAPGPAEIARRLESIQARYPWLVAECEGQFAGYAYATRWRDRRAYDWTAETAVYVAEGLRLRGIGLTLGAALLGALEARGYRSAVAGIALPNDPSRRLHRRLGYRPVGQVERAGWKFGRWVPIEFWEREIGSTPPPEPPQGPP